jgi:CDGSH-type Zn-finger protein/uncharacterized Fe-S cluster protein YjdI
VETFPRYIGTHTEELAMSVHKYSSTQVEVFYDAKLCIHAGECVRGAPEVFDPNAKPWVKPDAASTEKLAQVIARCPTGALTMRRHDGVVAETVDKNTVAISANGPLYLRGQLTVHGSDGVTTTMTRVALCRCGASKNKPFCDGSHRSSGFADAGGCAPKAAESAHAPHGPVAIKPSPNGSVMVEGWLELHAADGTTCISGDKTWLCRCGASKNKPFCDGSHKTIGFTA